VIVAAERAGLAGLRGDLAVSLGVFDGVHRGHQAVLAALAAAAAPRDERTLVVTLDPHPLEVLRPELAPPLLSTAAERVGLLGRLDPPPDAVLVHRFDAEVAQLAPAEFLESIVPDGARLARLVLGYDFRMGKDRSGGVEELAALGRGAGWEVVRVGPSAPDGAPVSSSRIRALVARGDVREAATLLGHPYRIDGRVVPGQGRGRRLRFPTANVAIPDPRKLLPADGVYALRARLPDEARPRDAVMNLGTRPTFGPGPRVLEVHLLGFDGNLPGASLTLELVERLRDERRFDGPEALAAAIAADVERARKVLQGGP